MLQANNDSVQHLCRDGKKLKSLQYSLTSTRAFICKETLSILPSILEEGNSFLLCNGWTETYLDERLLAYLRLAPAAFREENSERERERERRHELLSQDAVSLGRWLIGNPHTEPNTS
jgi:hypothetical protein